MESVDEGTMLGLLSRARRVLLVEPAKGTYIPLGLAKIASYIRAAGGSADFAEAGWRKGDYDLIAISTLFTYDADLYRETIQDIATYTAAPILVGGVCASLAPKLLEPNDPSQIFKARNKTHVFPGYSPELDRCVPDYSIDWGQRKGWERHSYVFTSRGCPNHCGYCAVPRLERTGKGVVITPNWRDHIVPDRRTCVVLDNNITSSPGTHLREVVDELVAKDKTVIFENGVDCKHIDEERAELLGRIRWAGNGLRIAFDRIEEDGVFQRAVGLLLRKGVHRRKIMSYVLYNFNDTPKDAEYRLLECARLGIQPYPQRFVPLGQPNRGNVHIGRHWTKQLGVAFAHYGIMGKFRVKGTTEKLVTFREFTSRPEIARKFRLSEQDLAALK